jgi:hypothetical protein
MSSDIIPILKRIHRKEAGVTVTEIDEGEL